MANQSNLDTVQMNPVETLTYMVGQSQLPETPFLDIIYREGPYTLWLGRDKEGEFFIGTDVKGKVSHTKLRHYEKIFLAVVLGLIMQGTDHLITWVCNDQGNLNFARYFGFEETGHIKAVNSLPTADPVVFREMLYVFPELDDNDNENS